MIRAEDITFQYPTVDDHALTDVSFTVAAGDVLGVVGPVDAGKTTLSMVLAGLAPAVTGGWREGVLSVAGRDPDVEDGSYVGLVFEDYSSQLTQVRVIEEVMVPLLARGFDRDAAEARASELLADVRLEGYDQRRTWELSGGEQQRVAIAAILAIDPEVVVFDTAIDMLDPKGQVMVSELIASLAGETTLVVTVDDPQHLVGIADQVVALQDGEVVAEGPADDILRRADLFADIGVAAPTCVGLADDLGLPTSPLTTDEFVDAIGATDVGGAVDRHRPIGDGAFGNPIIDVSGLEFAYDGEDPAITGVDLTVRAGEIHAIIGGNGAGKTTLSKLLCGLLDPDAGSVDIAGRDAARTPSRTLGESVGLALQNPDAQVSKRTVGDEVRFPLENRQYERSRFLGRRVAQRYSDAYVDQRAQAALERTGLVEDGVVNDDPTTLSLGHRRLTAIAAALAPAPDAMVLDEPTAGLDAGGRKRMAEIIDSLARDDRALVIVEHDMDFVAEVADRVTVLHDGSIVTTGTPRDVFSPENWDWLREHYLMPPRFARLADRIGVDAVNRAQLTGALTEEAIGA